MATTSLLGRRFFLAAVSTQRQLASTTLRSTHALAATTQQSYYQQQDSTRFNTSLLAAAGATLAATTALAANDKQNAKCCGIAGVVGAKGDARDYLVEGLTILKNRGYDSAGIATMDEKNPSLVRIIYICFSRYLMHQLGSSSLQSYGPI